MFLIYSTQYDHCVFWFTVSLVHFPNVWQFENGKAPMHISSRSLCPKLEWSCYDSHAISHMPWLNVILSVIYMYIWNSWCTALQSHTENMLCCLKGLGSGQAVEVQKVEVFYHFYGQAGSSNLLSYKPITIDQSSVVRKISGKTKS